MGAIVSNRLIILFTTLGMVISGLLWVSHSSDFALPCTGGGCDIVAQSPYSRIWGFPVAALGFAYFGMLGLFALSRLQYPEQWALYSKLIVALSTLGVLAFGYFTYIQIAVLKVMEKGGPCWWCLAAAGSNLLAWLVALVGFRALPPAEKLWTRELLQSVTLALLLIVAGFGFGAWQSSKRSQFVAQESDNERLTMLYLDGQGWRKGNPDAELIIVKFSDFQCPACKQAYEFMENTLMSRFGEKVLYIFRHYPLIQIHPMAWDAASAAEEAGKQGKFWEMYAELFKNQQGLSPNTIEQVAKKLGLDAKKVREAVDNRDLYFNKVYRDFEEGTKLGIQSTPTFIVVYQGKMYTAPGVMSLMNVLNNTPEIQEYLGEKIAPPISQ